MHLVRLGVHELEVDKVVIALQGGSGLVGGENFDCRTEFPGNDHNETVTRPRARTLVRVCSSGLDASDSFEHQCHAGKC